MSTFSRRAKAEAAKYQHQIHPKARHKYTFGSGCGAGEKGNKGFQPGNTCGGDGDGKNDAGDQGGGDKAKGWNSEVATKQLESLHDSPDGRKYAALRDAYDKLDEAGEIDSVEDPIAEMWSYPGRFGSEEELKETFEDNMIDAIANLELELALSGNIDLVEEATAAAEAQADAPAAGSTVYDQVKDFMDTNPTDDEIESFYINEILPQDKRSINEILEEDAPAADAGDQGGGDRRMTDAEAYKGVTEEDIKEMEDAGNWEEAEVMRDALKEADAPVTRDPDDFADNLLESIGSDLDMDSPEFKQAVSDPSTRSEYLETLSNDELRAVMQRQFYGGGDPEVADAASAVLNTRPDFPKPAASTAEFLTSQSEAADAPAADAGATVDVSEASGSGGGYEAQLPTGYEISHAGSGEKPWQITGEKAGGRSYSFSDESDAEIGSMALALVESSSNYDHLLLDDESNLQAFASYVTDHMGEYREVSSARVEELMDSYEDARIGQYEGGIAEYASQLIDDMGGVKEAIGDRASSYLDYDKWNTELENADEGYGFREAPSGGYEVYNRQDEEVEPTFYEFGYEAEEAAKEINNELLEEMVDMDQSHPGGESYAERYLDVSGWARDLELGGDFVDLGDGHLIWGH